MTRDSELRLRLILNILIELKDTGTVNKLLTLLKAIDILRPDKVEFAVYFIVDIPYSVLTICCKCIAEFFLWSPEKPNHMTLIHVKSWRFVYEGHQ